MTKPKKILFGIVALVLVCVLVVGGVLLARNANAETILVVPVQDLATYMYSEEMSMEGRVTTSVTQKVKLEQDSIIKETYVKAGDHVKRGDKLLSFDMTLKEMELEIDILTRQQQQQNLKKAQDRLRSLQNGGPIEESSDSDASTLPGDKGSLMGSDNNKGSDSSSSPLFDDTEKPEDLDESEDPGGLVITSDDGNQNTAITYGHIGMMPLFWGIPAFAGIQQLASFSPEGDFEVPGFTVEETITPTPTATPDLEEGVVFYQILTGLREHYSGEGTKEDPYIFLCSSKNGQVIVKGSFFNEMAGYNLEGTQVEKEGGYWYRLEFHQNDKYDEKEPERSLSGYYVRNGGLMKEPMDPEEERKFTLAEADSPGLDLDPEQVVTPIPTEEPDPDDNWDDDWWDDGNDDGDNSGSLTREEAIKQQKKLMKDLELQIKASDIKISRLQRTLEKKTVTSNVDGTVIKMGDPVTGTYDGDAFMTIQSDGGFFVKGSLSELMLDVLKPGDILQCMSYETGMNFQAEILEISEYPGNSNEYYGGGNSNASHYPFVASVQDNIELGNDEYVNITLNNSQEQDQVEIMTAFVRSENGQSYVYKEADGVLKRQVVETKASTDGYSTQILSGVDSEDRLAFPYGKGVKEGAKTKEGTISDLYGYGIG